MIGYDENEENKNTKTRQQDIVEDEENERKNKRYYDMHINNWTV